MAATFETLGAITSGDTDGTLVTAGSDTKGSWAELSASIGIAAKYMMVQWAAANGNSRLLDIGIGASGSEVVLIPDIFGDLGQPDVDLTKMIVFQVDITSGARIAARVEENGGTGANRIVVLVADAWLPNLSSPGSVSYVNNEGSAGVKGVSIDPGGTANTKGAWVEMTSSFVATGEHAFLIVGTGENIGAANSRFLFDIGIGAASSEVVVVADLHFRVDSGPDSPRPFKMGPFPADLLQGQRVAIRSQSSITNPTDRVLAATITVVTGTP